MAEEKSDATESQGQESPTPKKPEEIKAEQSEQKPEMDEAKSAEPANQAAAPESSKRADQPVKAEDKPDVPEAKRAKPAKPEGPVKAERPSPKEKVAVDEKGSIWMSRRNFFSRTGWVAFFSFVASMLIGSLRFMFPRVLFEPSPLFKAGFPDDYPVGQVSTKWVKDKRVWLVRNEEGFYAILATCTHLGCTPRWLEAENKFKCPCHGSGFTREGVNFEGPAPRPLERAQVMLGEDGQLVINSSIKFREEKGEWERPGAFLRG
ncbi:Rieske 2Fe-2S domain-containing protein [bacterium]|nr:Rieske 2Fe-2S domain-containing protein [bacterium]